MSKIRVRIIPRGARAVLLSGEVAADLEARVSAVQGAAGGGYEGDVRPGRSRLRGMVKTVTFAAARDNAKNNTLLKALDRGR